VTNLRVATYNVYLGADLTLIFGVRSNDHLLEQARLVHEQLVGTDFPSRAEAIARLIVRERIDVIGLQEVAQWSLSPLRSDGSQGEPVLWCDFLSELLHALARLGTPYDAHASNSNFHGGAAISTQEAMSVLGYNVILVRRDSGVAVTGSATGDFRASFDIATGMDALVLNIPRSWGWVDATIGGTAFRFVNTHTEAYDADTRNAQRDELLREVGDPSTPVVIVGDFNAGPDTAGMPPSYADAWATGGAEGPGYTCGQAADLANEDSLLAERIDFIWVRDAAVASCRVIGDIDTDRTRSRGLWPSDHACVMSDLRL